MGHIPTGRSSLDSQAEREVSPPHPPKALLPGIFWGRWGRKLGNFPGRAPLNSFHWSEIPFSLLLQTFPVL